MINSRWEYQNTVSSCLQYIFYSKTEPMGKKKSVPPYLLHFWKRVCIYYWHLLLVTDLEYHPRVLNNTWLSLLLLLKKKKKSVCRLTAISRKIVFCSACPLLAVIQYWIASEGLSNNWVKLSHNSFCLTWKIDTTIGEHSIYAYCLNTICISTLHSVLHLFTPLLWFIWSLAIPHFFFQPI